MDLLYCDLENYNDINTIEELRKENTELRFKLEEHKRTVDKLQKDIDKLSSEFKTMEINYSSLLKTARAEIERKTHIINNLNSKKDMLVLNSLQYSNKSLLNIKHNMTRDRSKTRWKEMHKTDLDSSKGKNVKDVPEMKKFETEKNRDIENRMPSTDTVTSGNTDDSNRLLNVESRADTYTEKSTDNNELPKSRNSPQGIKSRRKSMPALRQQYAKFSTDEEFEELYSVEENNIKEWTYGDKNSKALEKIYNKQSHKVSETSGIDDKYSSYHESSRETYYKGKSRYSDRYRSNRDRYDSTQRFRRNFSPERNRRTPRDHSDDRHQRIDFERQRVLESPPSQRSREYDSRRNRDRRSNYKRDNLYDEKHKLQERGIKHKAQTDYDEPISKRVRTISRGRPVEEDIRWLKVQEIAEPRLLPIHLPHDISCLSPDYINPEVFPAQPIREIRHTASTKLEDPRLTSKRYITKKDDKNTTLCSVTGGNVEMIPVDKTVWGVETVTVPEALQRPPPTAATNAAALVDNPESEFTLESEKVLQFGKVTTDTLFNDFENVRANEAVSVDVHKENPPLNQTAAENVPQSTKYKIPKVKKVQEETISQSIAENPNPLEMLMKDLKSKCEEKTHTHEIIEKGKPRKQKKESPKSVIDISTIEGKSEEDKPKEGIKLCISLSKLKCRQPQSAREIVAGDLELSDETCDDSEMQNESVSLKDKVKLDKSQKGVECGSYTSHDNSHKVQDSSNIESTKCVREEETSPESSKKHKTKRRSQKQKGSRELSEPTNTKNYPMKKHTTKKKSKDSKPYTTQDRQAKFSELFGDSSSLITPEDLGLAPVHAMSSSMLAKNYMPIFENAQDGVDVNVEEIGKAQKTSISAETNQVQNEPPNITEDKTKSKSDSECRKKKSKKFDNIKPDSTVDVPASTEEIQVHNSEPETINNKTDTPVGVASEPVLFKTALESIVSVAPTLENLNPKLVPKDCDVVKTVIISTGVQFQTTTDSVELPVSNNIVNLIEDIEKQDVSKVHDTPVHALATSTPYKGIPLVCSQIDSDLKPESSNSCDNRVDRNEASLDDHSSVSNLDVQEADAPDVRIFVRRRRKVKK